MSDETEQDDGGIGGLDLTTGRPVVLDAVQSEDGPSVVLSIKHEDEEMSLVDPVLMVLPWELSALLDMATGRPTRLPRLMDVPGASDSAPFDFVVGALLRDEPPPIETRENIQRMNQRQRAIRAMEHGQPAFDIVLRLTVPPGVTCSTEEAGWVM